MDPTIIAMITALANLILVLQRLAAASSKEERDQILVASRAEQELVAKDLLTLTANATARLEALKRGENPYGVA